MSKNMNADFILKTATVLMASTLLLIAAQSMAATEVLNTSDSKALKESSRLNAKKTKTSNQKAVAKKSASGTQKNQSAVSSSTATEPQATKVNTNSDANSMAEATTMTDVKKTMDSELALKSTAKAKEAKSPYSFVATLARARSLYDRLSDHYKEGSSVTAEMGIKVENWTYGSKIVYGFDDVDRSSSDFEDILLSATYKPTPVSQSWLFSPLLIGVMPASKDSSLRQNEYGALGTVAAFATKPGAFYKGFDLGFSVSLARLFHQYTTAIDDKVNKQWSSKQKLTAAYTYKDTVGVSFMFTHAFGRNYDGSMTQGFVHAEEIGWNITKKVAVALGHTLEGSVYKTGTNQTNINAVDSDDSVAYVSLAVSY